VRVVDGIDPLRLDILVADPAFWTIAIAGLGGFYLFTVALQLGSVNGAAAALSSARRWYPASWRGGAW
jgi:hypothetical protein